ncbi:MAG TPA: DNA primase [Gemmatimonadaceae bacterium]|nr:DNA primase [Gemmatimonadaceae bacterium]
MIPDDVIQQIRDAADIVQVVGEHVNLKRTGADYRGPCPFHQGTHRNFSVSPKKAMYYCFVCHEGGDVFDFVRKHLGLDWPSAVRYVAARAGVEVREVESRRNEPDPREPLWEAVAAAAAYFRDMLSDDQVGRAARDYLALRQIPREMSDRFQLGFAPRDGDLLRAHLGALGFDDERLLAAGLLHRRDDGTLRARFRNRLIFPILDAAGHTVGLGGRLLGPGEPKYLNSPDSEIFSKTHLLYGLHLARTAIRREERVMIVEGYFDVLRLVAAGFDWAVAPLGTALTSEQARLLRRYTEHALLLYDSDAAGLKATFRSGDELLRHGFAVQVVSLPEGEDPDSFVAARGAEGLREPLHAAIDIVERKILELQRKGYFADLQRKRRALDKLVPTLRAASDPLTREIYLTRVAEVAGVRRELLEREVDGSAPSVRDGSSRDEVPRARAATPRPERDVSASSPGGGRKEGAVGGSAPRRRVPGASAERDLLRVMLHHRAEIEPIAERVGPEEFRDPVYRAIFAGVLRLGGEFTIPALAAELDADGVATVETLSAERDAIVDVRRTIDDAASRIRRRRVEARSRELKRLLELAEEGEKDTLLRELEACARERRALDGTDDRAGRAG